MAVHYANAMEQFPAHTLSSCASHGAALGRQSLACRSSAQRLSLDRPLHLQFRVKCLEVGSCRHIGCVEHSSPGTLMAWGSSLAMLLRIGGRPRRRSSRSTRRNAERSLGGDYDARFGELAAELDKHATLGNVRKAELVFKQLDALGIPRNSNLPRVTHNTLLKAYANKGDFKRAEAWMKKMQQKGIELNWKSLGKLFEAAGKSGDVASVESMFPQALAAQQNDTKRVAWNVLMDVYAKHGHWQEAVTTLRRMTQQNITPETRDVSACINACAKAGRPAQAKALMEEIREQMLEPHVAAYTSLINAYDGNLNEAERAFRRMIKDNIEPDVPAYTSMIYACARAARKKPSEEVALKAVAYIREMKSQIVAPNETSYNVVIDTLATSNYVDDARALLQRKIDTDGLHFGPVAYTSILTAYKKAKRFDDAESWFQEMQSRVTLRSEDWSAAIDLYAEAGQLEEALKAWDSMRSARLQPTLLTPQSIIKAYVRRMDVDGAFAWLKSMPQRGFQPTPVSYTIITQCAAASSSMVEKLMRHMASSGVQPDQWCKSAFVQKLGKEPYDALAAKLNLKVGGYSKRRERNEADMQARRSKSLDRDRMKLPSKQPSNGNMR